MISQREFFAKNRYRFFVALFGLLALACIVAVGLRPKEAGIYGAVALFCLIMGCVVQYKGEQAYRRYQDAVNKNPNDDLK